MGHAMRSQTIIKHLRSEGHEVLITANNKAYKFFKEVYKDVHELKGVSFVVDSEGKVKVFKTLAEYFKTLPKYSYYNFKKLIKIIDDFSPDLVVTDFEPFAQVISNVYNLPLISIDNQHRITHCTLDIPREYRDEYLEAKTVIRSFIWTADYYIVTDFYNSKVRKSKEKVFVVPPVVREGVMKTKKSNQGHILVYMWEKYAKNLIPVLKKVKDQKFIVYGLNKSKRDGNVTLRPFSSTKMVKDLSSAKAVIANAGFTLMTESLFLHKPMLVAPMGSQFEQILNGLQLEKRDYGMMVDEIDQANIESFIKQLPRFKKAITKVKFDDNKKLFATLDRIIKRGVK